MNDQPPKPIGRQIDPKLLNYFDKLYWKTSEQVDSEFKKFDHSVMFLSSVGIGWLVELLLKGQPQLLPKIAILFFLVALCSSVLGLFSNALGLGKRKEDIMTAMNNLHTGCIEQLPLGMIIGFWSNWISIFSLILAFLTIGFMVFCGIEIKP